MSSVSAKSQVEHGGKACVSMTAGVFPALWPLQLLLACLINRQDVVFDEQRKFGSYGCRQCRQVIRPRRGNFHSDLGSRSDFSVNRMPLMGELCRFLPLRPFSSSHRCDMPVRWSHLSMADCHLVRLSSSRSIWICLFRSLSVSQAGFSRRFPSRPPESDLADAGRVGGKCRMWPAGIRGHWPYSLLLHGLFDSS